MTEPVPEPSTVPVATAVATTAVRGRAASGAASGRGLPLAHYAVAASCGALNTFSFAPVKHGGWFELAVFAALFALLRRSRSMRAAALTGGAFGFGNFVTGVWWLYVSMHDYGGMAASLAAAAVALFALYLALYPALSGGLWYACCMRPHRERMRPRPGGWGAGIGFACAWALGEWLRGWVLTGFPWLASGYAQVSGPLTGYAAVVGVYGVGWLAAYVAALFVQGASAACAPRRLRSAPAVALPLALALALLGGGLALSGVVWTRPTGEPLHVRLLQGNIPQSLKFSESGYRQSLALYRQLITGQPADLIVTPETAAPSLLPQLPEDFAQPVRRFADDTGTAILLGAFGARITGQGPTDFTNSLFGITPHQTTLYRYDKQHLVPFGEFVPWGFHWFVVGLMKIPLGDLVAGPVVQQPFFVRGQPIALGICYEDIFGEEIARTLRRQKTPAGLLVNSTNLGWFGNTIALDQHLQIARMRALETGRPVLRATNTGITAAINAKGHVLERLPPFTVGTLTVVVYGRSGITPYIAYGNLPVVLFSLFVLGVLAVATHSRQGFRLKARGNKGVA